MARKVTVLKAEQEAVQYAHDHFPALRDGGRFKAALASLLAKLEAPREVKVAGLGLLDVERALQGCRKYTRWLAGNPARHLATLQGAGATPEQVTKVGRWLDEQPWMRGTWTLGSLAAKWGEWYSQAAAAPVTSTIGSAPAGFAGECESCGGTSGYHGGTCRRFGV